MKDELPVCVVLGASDYTKIKTLERDRVRQLGKATERSRAVYDELEKQLGLSSEGWYEANLL